MKTEPDSGNLPGRNTIEAYNSLLDQVFSIPIPKMVPFKGHPFKVVDDDSMLRTMESIAQFGILSPLIVRPLEDGRYQIISGHRRAYAAALVGLTEVPAIVRQMDDNMATILMVDSNLQRESILPSERAFAYKMKLEAMKRQGERTDLTSDITSSQIGTKLRTDEQIAQQAGESRNQIQRYIRLTNLIPDLLELVDNKQISFNPAVELSYLTPKEQRYVVIAMEATQAAPSLSQAQRLKKLSQEGGCSLEVMRDILSEVKKGELDRVAFKSEQLRKYFPKSYTPKQMSEVIIKLLELWQRKRQRDQER